MKLAVALLLTFAALTSSPASAAETKVANVAEFDAAVKAAKPDDVIILRNGEWRDTELVLHANGVAPPVYMGKPNEVRSFHGCITLRAETPGQVILTGTSRLKIGGSWLIVEGLIWKNTSARDHVIAFRVDSKTPAQDCLLRQCAIIDDGAGDSTTDGGDSNKSAERKWVSIYGRRNKVERCRFDGKRSAGALMVVWIPDDAPLEIYHESADDPFKPAETPAADLLPAHEITGNFFGPRERLGKNGGETIRIGDSKTSLRECRTKVAENYFYRCDGEAEIISNKSCGNEYESNVFIGCSGALTLRHGNGCDVLGNVFDGDGRKGTGGVRVVGLRHRVSNNYFLRLAGDEVRAALCVMNGIPDSPADGYVQVRKLMVVDNKFIDCRTNILLGFADKDRKNQTLLPEASFVFNAVATKGSPVFVTKTPLYPTACDTNAYNGDLGPLPNAESRWRKIDREDIEALLRDDPQYISESTLETAGPTWLPASKEFLPRPATR